MSINSVGLKLEGTTELKEELNTIIGLLSKAIVPCGV